MLCTGAAPNLNLMECPQPAACCTLVSLPFEGSSRSTALLCHAGAASGRSGRRRQAYLPAPSEHRLFCCLRTCSVAVKFPLSARACAPATWPLRQQLALCAPCSPPAATSSCTRSPAARRACAPTPPPHPPPAASPPTARRCASWPSAWRMKMSPSGSRPPTLRCASLRRCPCNNYCLLRLVSARCRRGAHSRRRH